MNNEQFRHSSGQAGWAAQSEMNPVESMFWRADQVPGMRPNLLGIVVLDRSPDWDRLVARHEWLSRVVPWLHQRVVEPPLRVGRPFWTAASGFEVSQHLRRVRLSSPGSHRQLLDFAQALSAGPFDPSRPLWEAVLVEGVNGHGAAYLFKVHHCVTDGIGAAQLMYALHDTTPDPGPMSLVPPLRPGPTARRALMAGRLMRTVRRAASGSRRVVRHRAALSTGRSSTTRPRARDVPQVVSSLVHATLLPPVPPSPLLARRHRFPHFELMDVSITALKAAGKAAGGSLNDAYLAGLAGGFHRYHQRFGLSLDALPTVVPISVRTPDDPPGGNHLASTRLALPVGDHTPAERIRLINELVGQVRNGPALRALDLLSRPLSVMPAKVVALAGAQMFRGNDLLASNFAGIPVQVYLAGAKVTAFHPYPPLLRGAVSVALVSYQDRAQFGVNLDSGAVAEPELFMRCVREGLDDVLRLAPSPVDDGVPAQA